MVLIFQFALDPESNEAVFSGNIGLQQALQILQNIVVAESVKQVMEAQKKTGQKDKKCDKIAEKEVKK